MQAEDVWIFPGSNDFFLVIWRAPSFRRWHLIWRALIESKGEREYVVSTRGIWLSAPATSPEVLDRLVLLSDTFDPEREDSAFEVPQCVPE